MKKRFLLLGLFVCPSAAWAQGPWIFYTDLTSGPNTGGEDNNGTIVTLYGKRFGPAQEGSTVTIGTATVTDYKLWSDTKIAVAIGSAATAGSIVVHTTNRDSNGVPFLVRAGNIYCVSTTGNDNNSGQFPDQCWATLLQARWSMVPGDITYIEDGVSQTTEDDQGAALWLGDGGGTPDSPKAFVAYPGAAVTVGDVSATDYGVRGSGSAEGDDPWVIAGLVIRGNFEAVNLDRVDGWRVIGSEMACPNGSGAGACFHAERTTNLGFLGNYVHDTGAECTSDCDLYDAVRFSTNSNHIEAGWNTIAPNGGCRALDFSSDESSGQYDLHAHDNLIHDVICDGVTFSGVDPGQGSVEAYNNILYRVGTGPDPSGHVASYVCFNLDGSSASDATIELYNNTLFDCGARGNDDSGGFGVRSRTQLRNNILSQTSSASYFTANNGDCALISGSSNLWFGSGKPPDCSGLTAHVNADPNFVDAPADFHLGPGSPAIDSGTSIGELLTDFDGIIRPQGTNYAIGAYEFLSGQPLIGRLRANPHSIDFGTVAIGSIDTRNVTLTSAGTAAVTISQANLTGIGFSISGLSLPLTIPAGQSVVFNVLFAPSVLGSVTGSVSLVSDASDSPTTVSLSGTGISISHSVDLAWDDSTSPVAGYNIYRGKRSGGPYKRLNSSLVAETQYTDTTVRAGRTYFYVATAVDSDNVESDYSNEVRAVVPSP